MCDVLRTEGYNWDRALMLLDAAQRVDPDFKIMLMPDMATLSQEKKPEGNIARAIRIWAAHPAAYRLADGRLVVSPYTA